MYTEAKMLAYAKWHELLTDPDILMDAEERYDELLKLADDYRCRGIIEMSEHVRAQHIDRNCDSGLYAISSKPSKVRQGLSVAFGRLRDWTACLWLIAACNGAQQGAVRLISASHIQDQ